MAQEFAKAFYNSTAWQTARSVKIETAHHICERCGRPARRLIVHHKIRLTPSNISDASITLDQSMLEAVCWQCHNAIDHDDLEHDGEQVFTEDGDFIPVERTAPM